MKTSDFDFDLDERFIAQSPADPRDSSKLLVYDTLNDKIYHKRFFDLPNFLPNKSTLVFNKSKVFSARLNFLINAVKKEIFFLKLISQFEFLALTRPGKFFKKDKVVEIYGVKLRIKAVLDDGSYHFQVLEQSDDFSIFDFFEENADMPFPPYIKYDESLKDSYQTVYAEDSVKGSVAAPTAGLHFTNDLLSKIENEGHILSKVVLHVGRGTFLPVKSDDLLNHVMHEESYSVSKEQAAILNQSVLDSRFIIAVGTTSVRVLESNYDGVFVPEDSNTDIFIYPGAYKWKVVNGLITNFHLPKSTLIMLVASFLENKGVKNPIEKVLELYEIAKKENYRFYSFGDSMFIV